jgi:hypothetical protein
MRQDIIGHEDKIIFGCGIQDIMTISISCLFGGGRGKIKYKKKFYF